MPNISDFFLTKPILQAGVDIGSRFLKIALLQISAVQTKLLAFKCEDLSRFNDDEVKNAFILQQVDDFIKNNRLPRRTIHLNLPMTNAVYAKTIKLPHMPAKEIANAAKWQLKDEIQINPNNVEFAWQYASAQTKPPKPRIDIMCVAAKKDFLNKYIELFRRSNISLSEITFSPFSINATIAPDEQWIAVLDIGCKQSIFSMHSNGRLLFLRVIHSGANEFNAEHISDELVRSLKYCEIEFTKLAINQIYITGGGVRQETIPGLLKEKSGLDIKILRFPRDVYVDETIRKVFEQSRASLQILAAVGSAVPSVRKIDVLPLEARTEKFILAQKISFRLIGLTIALILLLSYSAIKLNVDIIKKRLSNATAELAFLKEAEVLHAQISEYNNAIKQITRQHIPADWTLKFISSAIPENMVLDSFTFSNKDKTVNVIGVIYAKEGSQEEIITNFIRALKQIELFKDAQLVSAEKTQGGYFSFNIACRLIE